MNRCTSCTPLPAGPSRRRWLATLLLASTTDLWAQTLRRSFPASALRGVLIVTSPPEITLDGRATRLSPGARIHNPQNMLVMSGALLGRELIVNYTRESGGGVNEVWILTPEEVLEDRPSAKY